MIRRLVCTAFVICTAIALHPEHAVWAQRAPGLPTSAAEPAPAIGTTGSILGVVSDFLHGGQLSEAVVSVVQLPRRSSMTNMEGAFRIDSIPPGRYTLELNHAVLDTLGVRVISDTIVVEAGALQTVTLAIPSASTIVANACTPLQRKLGPGALFGQVLDADTDVPVVGAEVSAAWIETTADPVRGITTGPRVRKVTVDSGGTFRLCGIPMGAHATLQASRGAAKTAEVEIVTSDNPLTVRYLRLGTPETAQSVSVADAAVAQADSAAVLPSHPVSPSKPKPKTLLRGPATVTGSITNRGGVALSGARVSVVGGVAQATANADGRFTLTDVPVGTQMVEVRQVGYEMVRVPLDVKSRGTNQLVVRLGMATVPTLAEVDVRAKMKSQLVRSGFEKRRALGIGKYLTEDDIARSQAILTSSALRRIPGLYVVGEGSGLTLYNRRDNGCVRYVIDRSPMDALSGMTLDQYIRADDIIGVEYYQTSELPEEFNYSRNKGCAILVIWTRASVKETKKP